MAWLERIENAAGSLRHTDGWVRVRLSQPSFRRRLFIVVATTLIGFYAAGVFAVALGAPEIGLRGAFTPVVMRVLPDFVRVLDGETNPETLDRRAKELRGRYAIVRLGDQDVSTWPQLIRVLADVHEAAPRRTLAADAWPGPEDTHVQRGGEEWVRAELVRLPGAPSGGLMPRLTPTGDVGKSGEARTTVWVRLGRLPLDLLVPSVLWFFLKAGLLAIAALVYWKRPDDRPAAQFFILSLVTFGAYMGGYHWSRLVGRPELLLVFIGCAVMLPAVSLHFYLVFPQPKAILARHGRWLLGLIYGVPLLFLLILVTGYLRVRMLFQHQAPAEVQELLLQEIVYEIYSFFAIAALWYLASAVCLVHSYLTAKDATARNQVRWILYGVAASLLPIGYTLYLSVARPDDFGGGGAAWPMFLASACVTFAFAVSITRYRLMQLDQIVSSGAMYFLFSSLAGIVYYTVVFAGTLLFHQWIASPSLTTALGVSTSALVLMLVLDGLLARRKRALDLRFFREKTQLDRTLRRMSRAIEQLVDPPTLARRLLQEAAELLGATRGALYLREGAPALYRMASSLGHEPTLTELPPGCPLLETLERVGTLADPATDPSAEPGLRQLRFLGGEAAVALAHEEQILALLVLGPRRDGEPYTAEELNLLSSLAQVGVLALASAVGHRTIEALNRELREKVEKIAEQQRRILALQSQLQLMNRAAAAAPNGHRPEPAEPEPPPDSGGILGSSPQVKQLLALVRKVSDSQATVLIRGESGTGKELLARSLHESSPRANKPFVKVHCAALSPGLLESELFGHVKGAYTGAHRDKVGRFELANGGTLFLDEIGDISLEVQTKLLRVLQEMTFERVGSSEPTRVDVRVIAATHQNLEELIRDGRFREDLYYRINVISIHTPPLRERREDIPELVQVFLRLAAQRCGRPAATIDDDALAALKSFHWPGNIRQLENVIERAVVVADGPLVTLTDLPPDVPREFDLHAEKPNGTHAEPIGLREEREERDRRERDRLVRALAEASGNKAEAARALGLARSTLLSRLKKHGLQ